MKVGKKGMERYLGELNPSQKEAVQYIDGPLLILAGAGSGKTKTLTTRLAYLLHQGIDPSSTLTLTFTNKAASEMRERALKMVPKDSPRPPLLSTFHKFGLLFLKMHIHLLNRKNSFVIIDTSDQKRIIKSISEDLPASYVAKEISKLKNAFLSPNDAFSMAKDTNDKKIAAIYEKYKNYLLQNNQTDFDDLLLLSYQILEDNPKLAEDISKKYQYIMIDEYQDTNGIQLKIIKKLCLTHDNICVVGDDDQSIYGFRGANIRNILEFNREFDAKVVKLEENYRSTEQILTCANNIIGYNKQRHDKQLKSVLGEGKAVEIATHYNENEESFSIAKRVKSLIQSGVNPREIAILYRINALSRSLEDGLRMQNVDYTLVGGTKFYEREEIKDVIAYLRLIVNEDDDSFRRIVNKPRRGIGKTSLDKLKAAKGNQGFMAFIKNDSLEFLSKKAATSLKEFYKTIEFFQTLSLFELVESLENIIGFTKFYKDEEKIYNLNEFYALLRENSKNEMTLAELLNEFSLQSDQDGVDDKAINIMTIHASKGLEFSYLFVIGLEEGYFPLGDSDIEEERRLAYVAVTRAKKELYLSNAKSRFFRGSRTNLIKSRFLTETGLLNEEKVIIEERQDIKKGDLVKHKLFGMGRVMGSTKAGKVYKLKINFGGNTREILSNFVVKI